MHHARRAVRGIDRDGVRVGLQGHVRVELRVAVRFAHIEVIDAVDVHHATAGQFHLAAGLREVVVDREAVPEPPLHRFAGVGRDRLAVEHKGEHFAVEGVMAHRTAVCAVELIFVARRHIAHLKSVGHAVGHRVTVGRQHTRAKPEFRVDAVFPPALVPRVQLIASAPILLPVPHRLVRAVVAVAARLGDEHLFLDDRSGSQRNHLGGRPLGHSPRDGRSGHHSQCGHPCGATPRPSSWPHGAPPRIFAMPPSCHGIPPCYNSFWRLYLPMCIFDTVAPRFSKYICGATVNFSQEYERDSTFVKPSKQMRRSVAFRSF